MTHVRFKTPDIRPLVAEVVRAATGSRPDAADVFPPADGSYYVRQWAGRDVELFLSRGLDGSWSLMHPCPRWRHNPGALRRPWQDRYLEASDLLDALGWEYEEAESCLCRQSGQTSDSSC